MFSQYHQCFVKSLTPKMLPWKNGLCIYTYVRNNFNVFKFPTDFEHPGIYLGHEMQLVRSTFTESHISITLFKNSWRSVNTTLRHRLSVSALLSDGRASWDGTIHVVLLQAAAVSSGIGSSSPFLCLLEAHSSKGGYVFCERKGDDLIAAHTLACDSCYEHSETLRRDGIAGLDCTLCVWLFGVPASQMFIQLYE